jgi:glycosyltransferase involved in cell wall biosynthesis
VSPEKSVRALGARPQWPRVSLGAAARGIRRLGAALPEALAPFVRRSSGPIDARTIVFFFGRAFNSFNVALGQLYASFARQCGDRFKVLRDEPRHFARYADGPAATVSWTHFWPDYCHPARSDGRRDYRLYAVNYERAPGARSLDPWTAHIAQEPFQVLAASSFCRSFLLEAGVDPARVGLLPLGYNPAFAALEPRTQVGSRVSYLLVTNSNDPARYDTAAALRSFARAFSRRRDRVRLVLRDYGGNASSLKEAWKLVADFDADLVAGHLSDRKLAALFRSADIYIAASRAEGFGMKMLEAGAAGLPLIAPLYSGPRDFLTEMTVVPVRFRLQAIGDTIDRRALRLDESYLDCVLDEESLTEQLTRSLEAAPQLKAEAAARARSIRERYAWSRIASLLEAVICGEHRS